MFVYSFKVSDELDTLIDVENLKDEYNKYGEKLGI